MNKLRVIDLLNKIANEEEVPKKIQVYSDIFVFDDSNKAYKHEETRTNLLRIYNGNILNYEAVIIEEDKKIEKMSDFYEEQINENGSMSELFNKHELKIIDKINEIIDKINSMEVK